MDIEWAACRPSLFFPLLGEGIRVEGPDGSSVSEFLAQAAGIDPAYLARRVQTVFLNGHPVDDLARTAVRGGDAIALSAALPGLAGAVLRRGSAYAAMRHSITWEGTPVEKGGAGTAAATLKLFNLVARELGPGLLAAGVRVPGEALCGFLERSFPGGAPAGDAVRLDGRPSGAGPWWRGLPPAETHRLRVLPAQETESGAPGAPREAVSPPS